MADCAPQENTKTRSDWRDRRVDKGLGGDWMDGYEMRVSQMDIIMM